MTRRRYEYPGIIMKYFLDNLNFDFYSNGENLFMECQMFYNYVIREISDKKYLKDSFIAGDFFIKNSNGDEELDVFIYFDKIAFDLTIDEILEAINEKYRNEVVLDKYSHCMGVLATFDLNLIKINKINLNFEEDTKTRRNVRNIRIHVCHKKCKSLIKYFNSNPSKIGYIYNSKHLITGKWFVKGGDLGIRMRDIVLEKFKHIDLISDTQHEAVLF
jgi:hypothetical protein